MLHFLKILIDLYKNYEGKLDNATEIKLKLFMLSDKRIDLLLKKEDFHKNTLSTSQILKNDLKQFINSLFSVALRTINPFNL